MHWLELSLQIGLPIALIALGLFAGSYTERAHYARIRERERRFLGTPAISSKHLDPDMRVGEAEMATGSVVISIDYFKRFVSAFRMLFGGEVHSYSSLIDRARREAILRMKESHPDADLFINTRLETSTISNAAGQSAVGTIEVLAYGTAIKLERARQPSTR